MIDVDSAEELVRLNSIQLALEEVELTSLHGRVLGSPIHATREQPPFNRVAMDGIAINFNSLKNNSFPLEGIQKAGMSSLKLKDMASALEVMTGAVLPEGTDTVIPYERMNIENGVATLEENLEVKLGQNIHKQGQDYAEGKLLLEAGTKLTAPAVAIIASQGLTHAEVKTYPKLAIVSTGDELIEPGKSCEPWQIWRSNAFGIKSELLSMGIPEDKVSLFHLEDEKEKVYESLKEILETHDGLIISGGVSMGKYDFVQVVMGDLGVKTHFYKITQKPGKPMYFGTGKKGQAIFALPGNPVSALVCMRRYVTPSLCTSLGEKEKQLNVILEEDLSFKKEFTFFKAVSLNSNGEGGLTVKPHKSNGSGDFSSLGNSDGFIELPAHKTNFKAGEVYKFFPWSGALS